MTSVSITQISTSGNPVPVHPVAYKGLRVMTTERLAKAFGAEPKHIQDNHANNRSRFVEGVHFFKVAGAELKALREQPDFVGLQISTMARHLILWPERGALNHAKILNTDEAWEVYERLVDTYFAVKETGIVSVASTEAGEMIRRTDGIARMLAHKVTVLEKMHADLISRVNDLMLAADGRVAAVERVSVHQLLEAAGAYQKRRKDLNLKIGYALRSTALREGVKGCRRCPHSNVWLFPVEFASDFMRQHGAALVAQHNAAVAGQGVLPFPIRRKKKVDLTGAPA